MIRWTKPTHLGLYCMSIKIENEFQQTMGTMLQTTYNPLRTLVQTKDCICE